MSEETKPGTYMDDDIRAQLNRIEESTARMERAVFGEESAGHTGLVEDVKAIKQWRDNATMKVVGTAGVVSGAILGFKTIIAKFL